MEEDIPDGGVDKSEDDNYEEDFVESDKTPAKNN